jgi:hypothetical protein
MSATHADRPFPGAGTRRVLALCAFFALAQAGCATTVEEKKESFAPYVDCRVGSTVFADFIKQRSVILIGGVEVIRAVIKEGRLFLSYRVRSNEPVKGISGKTAVKFKIKMPKISRALATPINPEGYFLTAAHCTDFLPVYLIHGTGGKASFAKARLLWMDEESDLSLLKADLKGVSRYDWSDFPEQGETVLAGGQSSPSAGMVLDTSSYTEKEDGDPMDTYVVVHDTPVQDGDSGGPILDLRGRLVAVHSSTGFDIFRMSKIRRSVRPDLRQLEELISSR